jgi:hypothetical protein
MLALLRPVLYGVSGACASAIVLWQVGAFLVFLLGISWSVLPYLIFVPALAIGGYVISRSIRSRDVQRHLIEGCIVGVIVMLVAIPIAGLEGGILKNLDTLLAPSGNGAGPDCSGNGGST